MSDVISHSRRDEIDNDINLVKLSPYKIVKGRYVAAMPVLRKVGYTPLNIEQIAEKRLEAIKSEDFEFFDGWCENYFGTCDGAACFNGEIKIIKNCNLLINIDSDTEISDDGWLVLTEEQYKQLKGKTFKLSELEHLSSLSSNRYTSKEHPNWKELLGDKNETAEYPTTWTEVLGDKQKTKEDQIWKELLGDKLESYIDAMFSEYFGNGTFLGRENKRRNRKVSRPFIQIDKRNFADSDVTVVTDDIMRVRFNLMNKSPTEHPILGSFSITPLKEGSYLYFDSLYPFRNLVGLDESLLKRAHILQQYYKN